MLEIRAFAGLGGADHGWLNAKHHFSFAGYHDAARMGFGNLRVWNDDTIQAGTGFSPHAHRDMEIITYVRAGAIAHKDSLGNVGKTTAGNVQVMSAGTGITHAEYNEESVATQIFQIWLLPRHAGNKPSWGMRPFPKADRANAFVTLASGFSADEAAGALRIDSDARLVAATLQAGHRLSYTLAPGHRGYLVAATGRLTVDGQAVNAGDGVAITAQASFALTAETDTELVMVDTRS